MNNHKIIHLASGSEDGIGWTLQTAVGANTKNFDGYFVTASCETTRKNRLRAKDRYWFSSRLGKAYMKDKQIHHQWGLGERCYVLTPEAHKIRDATEAENRNRIQ